MNHDHSLKEYNDTLAKHARNREFKTAVSYAPDERIQQKDMAIENMQKQALEREREEERKKMEKETFLERQKDNMTS